MNMTTETNDIPVTNIDPASAANAQPETTVSASAAPPTATPTAPPVFEPTAAEKIASGAYQHSAEAAEALRRGELAQYSSIDPNANSDDRLIALLSYVTQIFIPVIMPLIVLLSESSAKRPFQRYHAVQSLGFAVVFWSLMVMVGVGTTVMQIIPIIGALIAVLVVCLSPIAWFASTLLLLYYGLQAYKGRRFAIPGLTSFLRDQNWLA
jgi:uncharacterized membrane protein